MLSGDGCWAVDTSAEGAQISEAGTDEVAGSSSSAYCTSGPSFRGITFLYERRMLYLSVLGEAGDCSLSW